MIKNLLKKIRPHVRFADIVTTIGIAAILIVTSCQKDGLRDEIVDLKDSQVREIQTLHLEQQDEIAKMEVQLNKVKALNKALLAQLDTKAEKVADVKTYILKTVKTVGSDIAGQIAESVVTKGIKYNVPVPIIISVMERESHFNLQAIGGVGERGLMQVRFNVWSKKLNIKSKYDLHNIDIGIEKGVQVLEISLKDSKFNLHKAIRQYNSGSTSRGSETYVANVMKCMAKYEAHTSLRQIIKDKAKKEAEDGSNGSNGTIDSKNRGKATSSDNPSSI